MTHKMAAGQQKKRLANSHLHEQRKGKKKKKLDSSDFVLNLKPHIYLEWDASQKIALAKREQIAITWTDMAPFVASVPGISSGLADVLSVPEDIFSVGNLMEVLSYEVWATCLSESERKLLTQFLPSGTGVEQAVHSLLTGENHHFGNPFLKWSASLCSGNLHPDNVLRVERQSSANKKAYYSEINQYHTEMIEGLKKWKERWASCKDPEELRKGFTKLKQETVAISAERAKVAPNSKKEIPHKICIRNGDATKYMSYIKITRKQHCLVKNLTYSGDCIQSKSFNRVLGDIKGFHVYPYEAFEEEEKSRLHEHWLQIVNKDLPAAFRNRRDKKLQRVQWNILLEQELAERKKSIMDQTEESGNPESSPQGQIEDEVSEDSEDDPINMIHRDDIDSPSNPPHGHHLERIPSLNSHQELSPVVVDRQAAGQDVLEPADNSPILSRFFGKQNTTEDVFEPRAPISPVKEMWQDVSIRNSNYPPTSGSHRHTSSPSEFSLRQPQAAEERPTRMIDLERDILEHEAGEPDASALHMDSREPSFYSYASRNHDKLLSPFPKESGILSAAYPQGHVDNLKQPGLPFLMSNRSLPESGQFFCPFQEQQLLGQRQVREKEIFMHQVMNENMYSNGRYPIQGHSSSLEPHTSVAMQPSVNGGLLGHNWFPEEHRMHNSWSGADPNSGGRCLGDGGSTDGSLFSVLSECGKLPSRAPYDASTSEQFMRGRGFVGGGVSSNDNVYVYASHQPKSSSSLDASPTPPTFNMPWMNHPHPNSSLHDSIGKPFLKSWNQ